MGSGIRFREWVKMGLVRLGRVVLGEGEVGGGGRVGGERSECQTMTISREEEDKYVGAGKINWKLEGTTGVNRVVTGDNGC